MPGNLIRWTALLGAFLVVLLGLRDVAFGSTDAWIARAEIAFGAALLLVLAVTQRRDDALVNLPSALLKVQDRFADLEAVRKEHYKMRTSLDGQLKQVEGACQLLLGYQERLQHIVDQVADLRTRQAQIDESNMLLRQEVGEAGRREELWLKRALRFLDYLERVARHDGLEETTLRELRKSAEEYVRCL